jgi:NAD(P)-dependent dehydrogenase (short-subunit alcohol dehydrogenase family)
MPDSVALVTGCSSGFGYLLAEPLARAGFVVYATMRDPDGKNAKPAAELQQLSSLGLDVRVLPLDVTSDADVDAAVERIEREKGRIDVLVNNAGQMYAGVTEAFTVREFERQFQTNVFGLFRVTRAVLPAMRRQHSGLLIHVSSIVGRISPPFFGVYNASKWAVDALGETLRYELSPFGVDSVIVEPGPYHTSLFDEATKPADESRAAEYGGVAAIPAQLIAAFDNTFQTMKAETDPKAVVDAIIALIRTPAGQRSLRTVVGPLHFGAATANERTADLAKDMLGAVGLAHLENVATAQSAAAAAG